MTTLQSIRNHGTILLVVVGVAMLAFILGDFLNSGSSFFNKNRENIAEIAGHKVHHTEYQATIDQLTEVYKIEYGTSDINEDLSIQIRNQAWQLLLIKYTLTQQAELAGMNITAQELSQLCIGDNPHQVIRQLRSFQDQNGNFNSSALVNFLYSLDQEPESAEQAEYLQQAKTYWNYWETVVAIQYMQEKYTDLVSKLVTANNIDAKYAFEARQKTVDAQYVQQPYYAVADSLVKVTDGDIKALYNQNKEQYKQTPNRNIEYVTFPIVASEEDDAEVKKLITSLQADFCTMEDVALIVNSNSDILYDARDYSESTIPAEYKEFVFNKKAKKGDCTDITYNDGTYAIARIMDCGYTKADSVKLTLIATEEGQEDVEYGWFTADNLPKNIAEPAFNGKKGSTFTVNMGMSEQTYLIADKSVATPKAKVAILCRKVTPSTKTYGQLYNQAKQFIVANNNADSLHQAAIAQGLSVTPVYALNANTDKVNDLKGSRSIVKWAFEAKEGQVSDVYECGEQFVVAALTQVNDGEYRPIEDVKAELTIQAINNKKAEYITKQLKGINTLEEAAKVFDTEIKTAENISLASYRFGAAGAEPALIGTALAMEPNTVSAPVKGNNGIYMLSVNAAEVAQGDLNAEAEIQQLNMRTAYTIPYQVMSLITEKAEVVDERARIQ